MRTIINFIGLVLLLVLNACTESKEKTPPNILWLYVEDISQNLSCYGDTDVKTPNIDKLAEDGVKFTNTIMPAPVCSSTRSAIITGVMQTTVGVHNHHSSRSKESAITLPDYFKTLPELFKEQGYFTFNQGKDDYNFVYNRDSLYAGSYYENGMYGLVGEEIDWNLKKEGQPFFGQIQLYGNKYIYGRNFDEKIVRDIDPNDVNLPVYYAQTDFMKEEWATYLESVELTDRAVGEALSKLKEKGLLENTYVFFFSDHGMRLWRHKQFLYESGVKVPFILTYFGNDGKIQKGTVNNDIISGLDIGTTSLGLANIEIPKYTEGNDFLAANYIPREFAISARDRCDFSIDRVRAVRTNSFKYIRNYKADRPYMQPSYRDAWEVTKKMRQLYAEGKLDSVQARIWENDRPKEELYNLDNDPEELVNLANNPSYIKVLTQHRFILDKWVAETNDQGQYTEDIEGLKFMYNIWGEKCVNPEFEICKTDIVKTAKL